MPSCQPPHVVWIMGCDDCGAELESGGNDEGVDGMSAGELGASEDCPGASRDVRRQRRDDDPAVGKDVVDGCVPSAAAAHLREHRGRDAHERLLLVGHGEDSACPEGERGPFAGASQGVERL